MEIHPLRSRLLNGIGLLLFFGRVLEKYRQRFWRAIRFLRQCIHDCGILIALTSGNQIFGRELLCTQDVGLEIVLLCAVQRRVKRQQATLRDRTDVCGVLGTILLIRLGQPSPLIALLLCPVPFAGEKGGPHK
ncbi:MAG TPA: hypothetical protein VFO39_14830 [Candidatus Sulfotelmatobacter sp.]|nr:hypothetical protein [Candidatus Sulfotelmatobacter sp.]